MIGFTGCFLAVWKNSYAPNMLPWSVIAIAGICWRAASASSSPFLAAPSSIEYSVWTCRWTNDELTGTGSLLNDDLAERSGATVTRGRVPTAAGLQDSGEPP